MSADNKQVSVSMFEVFLRILTFQFSKNYERMQSLGFLYCMIPFLKKIYKDADKETRSEAMRRHLEYFNTQPTMAGIVVGTAGALEESTAESGKEAVKGLKVGLMGPLAGIGDSLIWFTWLPICSAIGVTFAMQGNVIGAVITFVLFNALNLPIKYYGLIYGYQKGKEIFATASNDIVQRFARIGTALGLTVMGGLIAQLVVIKVKYNIEISGYKLAFQEVFDKIMPAMLPLLLTMTVYFSLKKHQQRNVLHWIFGVIVASVFLVWGKIL